MRSGFGKRATVLAVAAVACLAGGYDARAVDIEAGPIWSNADAQTKCPRVCASRNLVWNGHWVTTVQGRMSVCNCERSRTAPAAPQPVQARSGDACPAPGSVRSLDSRMRTTVQFANSTRGRVQVYWLDFQGQRQFYRALEPGQDYTQQTYVSHAWVVVDGRGRCKGGVFWPQVGRNINEVFD
jgi:hypothetical protein